METPAGKSSSHALATGSDEAGAGRWLIGVVPAAVFAGVVAATLGNMLLPGAGIDPSIPGLVAVFGLMHSAVAGTLVAGAALMPSGSVLARLNLPRGLWRGLRDDSALSAVYALLFFPVSVLVSAGTGALLSKLGLWQPQASPLFEFIRIDRPFLLTATVLGVCVLAPISEEFFFRLGLYDLLRRLRAPMPALCVAVAFAVVHGQVHATPALMLLSLLLQRLRTATGALYSPILMHAGHNLLSVLTFLVVTSVSHV